jgi:hypothetical protein
MSCRSGDLSAVARSAEVEAAVGDNHSDISPFKINHNAWSDRQVGPGRIHQIKRVAVWKKELSICAV